MQRAIISAALTAIFAVPVVTAQKTEWRFYNGGPDGDHYSSLKQITRTNVKQLQQAWTFDTEEKGGLQDNPLIIGGTLYAYTPTQKVIALDPTFAIGRFAVTVGFEPAVFTPLSVAWEAAGLPK